MTLISRRTLLHTLLMQSAWTRFSFAQTRAVGKPKPLLSRGLLYVVQNTREVTRVNGPRLLCYDLRAS